MSDYRLLHFLLWRWLLGRLDVGSTVSLLGCALLGLAALRHGVRCGYKGQRVSR